jgi:cellulose synthase/poly-beta-1,6-N-acetylglucosamine synthase-like glycosyltransferase
MLRHGGRFIVDVRREIAISRVSTALVLVFLAMFLASLPSVDDPSALLPWSSLEKIAFVAIVLLLACGNLIYHFTRLGYLHRQQAHRSLSRDALDQLYDGFAPRLAVLVPSYKEEPRVLLQTILSVALMEYPHRRVAILIDDPPQARGADLTALLETRALIKDLNERFASRARALHRAQLTFMTRAKIGPLDWRAETSQVAQLYEEIASSLDLWADQIKASSTKASAHTDQAFIEKIL